jgi:hypothetical protein
MGLDISVHINAALIPSPTDAQMDELDCVSNDAFPARLDGMESGWYASERVSHFHAGAYSSYNYWRNELCKAIYGIAAEEWWKTPMAESDQPFAELIDMSDCEGDIGPSVCRKLADDFDKHYDKLKEIEEVTDYDRLDNFRNAFRTAGDNNGYVSFH